MSEEASLDDFVEEESPPKNKTQRVRLGPISAKVPVDWRVKPMKSVYRETSIGTSDRGNGNQENLPLIKMGDIKRGDTFISGIDEEIKKTDELLEEHSLKKGDLLFNTRNTPELVGKTAVWDGHCTAVYDNNISRVRFKSNISTLFVNYFLSSELGWRQLRARVQGTTSVAAIYNSEFDKFQILLPSLEEQRKISSVLYTLDQAIIQTEEIINQANKVKEAVIQEFYSDGYYDHDEWQEGNKQDAYVMTRADEVPADWKICEADEIADIKTGHTPSTSVDEYWGGSISWVDIHDLTQLEKNVITTTDDTITEEGLENSGAKLLPEGTLVLCRTGAIGETAILGKEMATDQDQVTFECDEDVVLPQYLMYLFEYATPQLERLSAGSTHDKIQLHFFSDLEIPLPSFEEQEKIVEAIESVDDVVVTNKEQLENLQRLKKGLEQDLLSGEVRTAGKEIDIPDEVKQYEPE
ncbi:restriction endonuclease subunit S [Natronolimnohabitans innermongolicus]|uniref:restriction endonuclease subunit S n=1 Tax=Natronolimnohabitans innermongolicus TaxID=253107 RepID=UPI000A02F62C|nr:restriction endonuclease subunit S [Natronolimnohabitans innermongolicus]